MINARNSCNHIADIQRQHSTLNHRLIFYWMMWKCTGARKNSDIQKVGRKWKCQKVLNKLTYRLFIGKDRIRECWPIGWTSRSAEHPNQSSSLLDRPGCPIGWHQQHLTKTSPILSCFTYKHTKHIHNYTKYNYMLTEATDVIALTDSPSDVAVVPSNIVFISSCCVFSL